MKVIVYSTKNFERPFLQKVFQPPVEPFYTDKALSMETAALAYGYEAVCIFANDDASAPVLKQLHLLGIRYVAIRAAGYDNVHLETANELGMRVANVPEYSPHAIAEHAIALMLALNRKLILASEQVHLQDFTLDRLVGFDLNKKKVGIIGTGRIGKVMAKILHGFGCTILAYDIKQDADLENSYGVFYVGLNTLCSMSDIISIHLPLTKETKYLINRDKISSMKKGVMLINTSRGGVLKTEDVIPFLQNGHIGYLGLDVYEKEKGLFFYDHSNKPVEDALLSKLLSFRNVLITPHQAFATTEALSNIAATTFYNLQCWAQSMPAPNELTYRQVLQQPVKDTVNSPQ
ncbi:MAG: 2-hydroxyacid dehydrogenase [Bacteroidota bacterium]|nr:2-hydroxyacid dehydrogenase [Bacteroidota bacterium]